MKKKFIIASILVFIISSCSKSGEKQQTGFKVSGKVSNNHDKVLYLQELTPSGLRNLDSSVVNTDGEFSFHGKITESIFCILTFPRNATIFLLDTNSDIRLTIDAEKPEEYTVVGSPETTKLKKLLDMNSKFMVLVQEIQKKYTSLSPNALYYADGQLKIRNEYDSLMNARKVELQKYTLATEPSVVAYFAPNFLMPESDFGFLEKVDQKFYAPNFSSKYAHDLHARVEELRKTAVGQIAPDIVLPDPFGKAIALSSLRGKFVLVDFWASWCKPCREENPNLVKAFTKYRNKGFEIFSVSLDENRDAWQKAINDDRLLWTHVSDLSKWNSAVVGMYKIESIPSNVLIDRDGKILAKNLRGEELEKKLGEVFSR
ncbi:MAG: thioredoxin-like domain-containing protein [Bacteroidia bacterium]